MEPLSLEEIMAICESTDLPEASVRYIDLHFRQAESRVASMKTSEEVPEDDIFARYYLLHESDQPSHRQRVLMFAYEVAKNPSLIPVDSK
jgi:hypothetical protein